MMLHQEPECDVKYISQWDSHFCFTHFQWVEPREEGSQRPLTPTERRERSVG